LAAQSFGQQLYDLVLVTDRPKRCRKVITGWPFLRLHYAPLDPWIRERMLLLPSFVKLSLIVTGGKLKGERPGTTPAYIADWWDGTAAVETVIAKIGRRSVTSNTGDVVGGFKGRRIGEDKPGTQPDCPARPGDAITSGIQPQMTLAEV
jgi:hypothetical protein